MISKKYFFVIIYLIFASEYSYSQIYRSSLIAEGAILPTESHNVEIDKGIVTKEINIQETIGGFSISYCGKFHLGSEYFIELRTGVMFSQTFYDGIQLGLNFRKEISRLIGFIGYDYNYNFNTSHGTVNTENPVNSTNCFTIGTGFKINKIFNVLVSYNKLFDDYIGSSQSSDLISKTIASQKYVDHYFKLGIELNL